MGEGKIMRRITEEKTGYLYSQGGGKRVRRRGKKLNKTREEIVSEN